MPVSKNLDNRCPKLAIPFEDRQREPVHRDPGIQGRRRSHLMYGAETWVLYRKQIGLVERFHQRCLRSILGIKWQDHVSNEEVLKRASMCSI